MSLLKGIADAVNETTTLNKAKAYRTTKSDVLDLFAIGGAIRGADEATTYQLISKAMSEDLDLGLRTVLFLSDVRGGQGERKLFKVALKVLIDNYDRAIVEAVIRKIPELTRWDYVFEFMGTTYENYVLNMISDEIDRVEKSTDGATSLLFKWLPSIQRKPALAKSIAKHNGLGNKEYRQMLSRERARLKVVEVDMSAKNWGDINYSGVPSKASMIYRKAFERNDGERYNEFIKAVKSGDKTINTGTLYPHEIVSKARDGENSDTLNAMWDNLPDYVTNKEHYVIPLVDVSGSMTWNNIGGNTQTEPLDVAIGLGIYLAERNEGPFKDHFITFSTNPDLVKIQGNSIYQKVRNMSNANWDGSTDVLKAFRLILDTAVKNNLPQKDMPKTVVIFSDMEFDRCVAMNTPYETIEREFRDAGYEKPQLVFWNLDAKTKQHPVTMNEKGTTLVSGFSPVTLKYVLTNEIKTPYELMLEVIMNERYKVL